MARATLTSLGPCAPMRRRCKLKLLLGAWICRVSPHFKPFHAKWAGLQLQSRPFCCPYPPNRGSIVTQHARETPEIRGSEDHSGPRLKVFQLLGSRSNECEVETTSARTNCLVSDERRNHILRTSSLKCPKVETEPPGRPKTGPGQAETKRRARTTKHAPSALTPMPAESSTGAQTLVVAPLRAAGNQPHGNPSYHPSCNRQPDARYALHNSIDNHHPALLSTIDTGAKLIPAWPVESPHIARAREAIRTTRYKLCRALIASLTMPLLMR